jgi:hypothetical protein
MESDTFPYTVNSALATNLSQVAYTVIAQSTMCAYPISDIYAPTPRYLYYSLLLSVIPHIRDIANPMAFQHISYWRCRLRC